MSPQKPKKVVFVINSIQFFLSHRLPIAVQLQKDGYEVHIITPDKKPCDFDVHHFHYHKIIMSRKGMNPFIDLYTLLSLFIKFKKINPTIVHLVTIKPYLYGGIAARLAKVPVLVSAVAGLGIIFSKKNIKTQNIRSILFPLYKFAFGHKNQTIIFQNKTDKKTLLDWLNLSEEKTSLIDGAGTDLDLYPFLPELNSEIPIIAFASRLLKDKGIEHFVEASNILKQRKINARFLLIGEPDLGNPNTISENQLKEWEKEKLVEVLGYRNDIPALFSKAHIVSLPSFYGEGLPKVLIEAAACGRAVVTTDWPGCRDAIIPNKTGLLVPIKDSTALADAFQTLIENPTLRQSMGVAGRKLAEEKFDVKLVVKKHIEIYDTLLKNI